MDFRLEGPCIYNIRNFGASFKKSYFSCLLTKKQDRTDGRAIFHLRDLVDQNHFITTFMLVTKIILLTKIILVTKIFAPSYRYDYHKSFR